MTGFQIRTLSNQFYIDYPISQYPEILYKNIRSYDVVVLELDFLKGKYVCVPFRSEMRHNNGYKFKYSKRSKAHQSGLDFSKLIILNTSSYFLHYSNIDQDEFNEFKLYADTIHKRLEKYILNYRNHKLGINILTTNHYNRLYKYSTLKYFHKELEIE